MSAIADCIEYASPVLECAEEAVAELAAKDAVIEAARRLYAYRCGNTLNFQLEKADDYFREIDASLRELEIIEQTHPE